MASTASNRPPNRLGREASPYLRQHAFNPVDWQPWGPAAFAEARNRDVPIFLSIGYSTCYWCHVMERESFESDAIAAKLNEAFVCVKVDREERPDVDDAYMAAVQAFSGRGGWPMTVVLEPVGLRPFWAATYLPPDERPGMGVPGLPRVIEALASAWRDRRAEVLGQAQQLAEAARERVEERFEPVRPTVEHVQRAIGELLRLHDARQGGFGPAPKFPQPVFLELLLDVRDAVDEQSRAAIDAACRGTLDAMALGGIFDQIAGGFHRYSVDAAWTVPHFEKMLYDNAQLISAYARAWAVYGDELYRRTAARTCDYVLREMTDSGGAFFAAQDAEVAAREGLSYLWTPEEVRQVLSQDDARIAVEAYGLAGGPNFRDPHHPAEQPPNVLRWSDRPEALAARLGLTPSQLIERIDRTNQRLLEVRNTREQPGTDDKLITAWNGMMIHAFVRASELLSEPRLLAAAERAFVTVCERAVRSDGLLLRTWRDGVAGPSGVLEDYAWLACAGLALHRAKQAGEHSDGASPISVARRLLRTVDRQFADPDSPLGVFDVPATHGDDALFVRPRSAYDGAMPSGVSVLTHAWLDLGACDQADGRSAVAASERAAELLLSVGGAIERSPLATANSTRALVRLLAGHAGLLDARAAALGVRGSRSAASAATAWAPDPDGEQAPVQVLASVDRVEVGPDQPASFDIRLVIAEPYHINAAVPLAAGSDGEGDRYAGTPLVGLRVGVAHGTGVHAYADYPQGEPAGVGGELRVHRGTLDLTIAVEREGEWTGRPVLTLTYQPCTDEYCLQPVTVELDIAIDRA